MTAEATRESMTIRAYKYDGTLLDTYTKKRTDCELGKHTFNSTSLYDMHYGKRSPAPGAAAPVDAAITDYNGVLATTDGKHTILADGVPKKDEFRASARRTITPARTATPT